MTEGKIRQKAIECGHAFETMCNSKECEIDEANNTICHCEYNEVGNVAPCGVAYGYEHGFADGVEEERRRIYEEHMKAAKADSEASIHGDMFPKNVERFWQQMKGEDI